MIFSMIPVSFFTMANSVLKFCRVCSISPDRDAIVVVVVTRSSRSAELTFACCIEVDVRETICSIISATWFTCAWMSEVISLEEVVLFCKSVLWSFNFCKLSTTIVAPWLFSEASSRTTVIPFVIVLHACFTCSTVVITRCRSDLILSVMAPSDSFKCRMDMT